MLRYSWHRKSCIYTYLLYTVGLKISILLWNDSHNLCHEHPSPSEVSSHNQYLLSFVCVTRTQCKFYSLSNLYVYSTALFTIGSVLLISRNYSSCITKTSYPWLIHSNFPLPSAPGNHHSNLSINHLQWTWIIPINAAVLVPTSADAWDAFLAQEISMFRSFVSGKPTLTNLQQQFFYSKKIGHASTFTRANLYSINPASK